MTNEDRIPIRRKLREAIESQTPSAGLLNTGTGVAFWREQTFLLIAGTVERALDAMTARAYQQGATQAYEEVEQILDRRAAIADRGDVDTGAAARAALDEAALEVRSLKDSLVSVESSST